MGKWRQNVNVALYHTTRQARFGSSHFNFRAFDIDH